MLGLISRVGASGYDLIILLGCFVFAVLSALILHEVAHGVVAYRCGDPSAKFAGRLSLNPAKHLDPFGTLCFLLFGFGWAIPVPVNPSNFRHRKLGCVLVSLAGIAVNLALAFISSFFFVWLYGKTIWYHLFEYMTLINVVFATFNLLPIAPLDGFNLVAALAPDSSYVRFMRQNHLVAMLILIGVLYFTNILTMLQNWLCGLFLDFWSLII